MEENRDYEQENFIWMFGSAGFVYLRLRRESTKGTDREFGEM
ncbi:hypothetical protein SPHINGO8BC_70130 [Sphingobacterium multivorum]|uniref:Uncharacterized protein n=1 Tax=Sphingobacterium multivorum TaxID=28454 RepID=A0A654DL42_SPHMU|nr:hypothetical protein SPHINGO8BC_70130 [Sphingobacterium multivorum]